MLVNAWGYLMTDFYSEEWPQHETVNLINASSINPEPIRWIWKDWLAAGKFHLLAGPAGTGKTTVMLSIAAAITSGHKLPDGIRPDKGRVLIWSGEDDAKDTLVPRLLACGADRDMIDFVGSVTEEGYSRSFDPSSDVNKLVEALNSKGTKPSLMIVDPIVSAVATDSHKNGEVRRALQPLVNLADKLDCAVLGITHFSKGTGGKDPVERVTGSLAFSALARIVMICAKKTDEESEVRLFAKAKSNIGSDSGGFEYHLEQVEATKDIFNTRVVWGNTVAGSARELLQEADDFEAERKSALSEAVEWLKEELKDGPISSVDIFSKAKQEGISKSTLNRAKRNAKVKPQKCGDTWNWQLMNQDTQT